jgi:phospholipase/lecithinase/hemolysin
MHPMNMWNFAISGAVVDAKVVDGNPQYTPMTEQYNWFLKNMAPGKQFSNWKGESSLFAIWFGINDIGSKRRNEGLTSSQIDEKIATSMFNMIDGMYKQGARNFMFIFVPTIEKCPAYSNGNNPNIKSDIPNYNSNLNKYAKNFQASHPDTNVFVYDSYNEFDYIMENKSQYGITNIDSTCGGGFGFGWGWGNQNNCDSNTYFWKDVIHPTPTVHKPLAQDIEDFLIENEKASQQIFSKGNQGNQGNEGNCWSTALGYPCCSSANAEVYFTDESGDWGIENNTWCGIPNNVNPPCWAKELGYECCSTNSCRNAIYTDDDGEWDVENGNWCGITSANIKC